MEIRARKWLAGVAALLMWAGCREEGADEILPSPQVLRSAEPRPEVVEPSVGGMPREEVLPPPEEAARGVTGQVVVAGPEELRVAVSGEPELRLVVTPRTVVLVDGQMGTTIDIPEGSAVRVVYREQEGEPVAYFVEVRTRAQRPETPPGRGGEEEFQTPLDED